MIRISQQSIILYQVTLQITTLLALVVGLAACGEQTPPAKKQHSVLVTTVHNESDSHMRSFTGTVHARYESEQGFRTGGKITTRLVEVGQKVSAGQVLARLDPSDYELALRAAEDQWQAARVDAEQAASDEARLQRLLADHSVSVGDHERQKARADAAAARQAQALRQLDLARNKMKYVTLVAEFDGVVTSIRFEIGQVVSEGQPIVTIAKPSELEVLVDLPEEIVDNVSAFSASATLWGASDIAFPVKLRTLSPVASVQTRTFRARFSVMDKSASVRNALHIGTTASIHLTENNKELVAELPAPAVWKTSGKSMVWQVSHVEHTIIAQPVDVVRYTNDTVLVRGLEDGAKVVSAGVQKLTAGLEVVPVERTASGLNMMPPVQTIKDDALGSAL